MANKSIKLGDNVINEESPVYFISEIGINHNGDMQIAKKLLDATFVADWQCAKFQKRTPDIAVPEAQKNVERDTPWGRMRYIDYKKRIEFEKSDYDYIDAYCKQKPLQWTVSVWDIPSIEFILYYDIPFIKIPSALIGNEQLICEAAKSGKPIIASTGMSTLEEVDRLVSWLEKYGTGDYILMHTNSSYPAPHEELNLRVIETLRNRYNCIVGYSGHEEDIEPTVIAVSLGAKIVERHITLSHDMWGTDQKASLEIEGMRRVKNRCEDVLKVLGDGQKILLESELKKREELRGK